MGVADFSQVAWNQPVREHSAVSS